jgi:hypothetical protein
MNCPAGYTVKEFPGVRICLDAAGYDTIHAGLNYWNARHDCQQHPHKLLIPAALALFAPGWWKLAAVPAFFFLNMSFGGPSCGDLFTNPAILRGRQFAQYIDANGYATSRPYEEKTAA